VEAAVKEKVIALTDRFPLYPHLGLTRYALSLLRFRRQPGEGFAARRRRRRDPQAPGLSRLRRTLHHLRARAAARPAGSEEDRPAGSLRSRQAGEILPDRAAQASGRSRAHRSRRLRHRPPAGKLGKPRSPQTRSACWCLRRSRRWMMWGSSAMPRSTAISPGPEDFERTIAELTARIAMTVPSGILTRWSKARDRRYMAAAIRLARWHEGRTGSNPSVATLIVREIDGAPVIVGRGVTAMGGRPHAEPQALAEAGDLARGATAYVTLEPCAHHGRTPPCARRPSSRRCHQRRGRCDRSRRACLGRGYAILRAAGIEVEENVLAREAERDLAGYLKRRTSNRVHVTLKLAVSAQRQDRPSRWKAGGHQRGDRPSAGPCAPRTAPM
jgi:pyrimidine deaminase RibD-like protein